MVCPRPHLTQYTVFQVLNLVVVDSDWPIVATVPNVHDFVFSIFSVGHLIGYPVHTIVTLVRSLMYRTHC